MSWPQLAMRLMSLREEVEALCTPGNTDEILQHGVIASGLGFMKKPLNPGRLLLNIRTVLAG